MSTVATLCSCGDLGTHEIGRRRTADGKDVLLWSDGPLTWAMGYRIRGIGEPRTPEAARLARKAGWLVLGDVCLYDAGEVRDLYRAALWAAGRDGLPGTMRARFHALAPLRPAWTVQQTDRDGRPRSRVWRLSRLTHPGLAVWDEASPRGRYQVMAEVARGSGTYAPTGVNFHRLADLQAYLAETSALFG